MKIALVLLVLALGFVAVAVALAAAKAGSDSNEPWPFFVRKPMTAPEQILYFRLRDALPEHIVLAQVQLSRFLGVKKGERAQLWLNRINRLSVDFLILKKDASVVAAIELDDKSHERRDRRAADERKTRAVTDAGVPLIRWNVSNLPSATEIQADLASVSVRPSAPDKAGRVEPVLSHVPKVRGAKALT